MIPSSIIIDFIHDFIKILSLYPGVDVLCDAIKLISDEILLRFISLGFGIN